MTKKIVMVIALLPLAACAGGGLGGGTCKPGSFSSYIGQSKASMIGISAPGPVRFMSPGKPATADHEPSRLNVMLDGQGIIRGFKCG